MLAPQRFTPFTTVLPARAQNGSLRRMSRNIARSRLTVEVWPLSASSAGKRCPPPWFDEHPMAWSVKECWTERPFIVWL